MVNPRVKRPIRTGTAIPDRTDLSRVQEVVAIFEGGQTLLLLLLLVLREGGGVNINVRGSGSSVVVAARWAWITRSGVAWRLLRCF